MDILDFAAIQMPCFHCEQAYSVPLSNILLSHKIMHNGCPVIHETECPPVFHSRLATESAIENLRRAWRRLEKKALQQGGKLVLLRTGAKAKTGARKEESGPASVKNRTVKPRSHAA
jgi:hypothetical protein